FVPAAPPTLPSGLGGNSPTPSVVENPAGPQININRGGGLPGTPQPFPATQGGLNFSTPININFAPETINTSPIVNDLSNLNNSSLTVQEPFEGFPRLNPSLEEAISRLESLLDSPPKSNTVPIVPDIAEIPLELNRETTVPPPVTLLPPVIEVPVNLNMDTTPPENINLRDRLTSLSPVTNPMLSRLRSRLEDQRKDETFDEDTDEIGGGSFGNLSWRAFDSNLNKAPSSKKAPLGTVQKSTPTTPWSWDYHHRVVRETRSKCYTQGIRKQAIAEARLSSMIREHGLRAAGQGMVDSFNQARLKWTSNAMEKINAPDKKIRLVQPDLTNLLTDDEEVEENEDEEEEDDTD
ncbi:unnamed protein product, partial [Rotaria magnacalcarata]